ncbi:MAG: RluA family pseudouridine synthase, partial [Candidatus Methylomirabilis sp.]|nr:RluA family pseudouridine synthase [Deltaproteobacteria bacterium]
MSPRSLTFLVPPLSAKTRLDRWLAEQESLRAEGRSRSQIAGWIEAGLVLVDGKTGKPGLALSGGERVDVTVPPPREIRAAPEALEIAVVYEDADMAVVVKPAGMVTHPAPGSPSGTLVNALLHRLRDLSGVGGALRPGIVHRLDKETSGLLVVAKNDFAHRNLSAALKAREVRRTYLGLVHGKMPREAGTIDAPIGRHRTERKRMSVRAPVSRSAVTHWRLLR